MATINYNTGPLNQESTNKLNIQIKELEERNEKIKIEIKEAKENGNIKLADDLEDEKVDNEATIKSLKNRINPGVKLKDDFGGLY